MTVSTLEALLVGVLLLAAMSTSQGAETVIHERAGHPSWRRR